MSINYANFSEDVKSTTPEPIPAEFMDVVNDELVEEVETVETIEEPIEEVEPVEESLPTSSKMGYVECGKLYLRSEPSADSKEVTILNKGEELMIVSEEDPEWYGVYTAAGQEGFCKKEFIKVD